MFPLGAEELYHNGDIIFEEGAPAEGLYLILSGAVEISRKIRGEKVLIDILEPGDVFGDLASLGCDRVTLTSHAVGKTSIAPIDSDSTSIGLAGLSPDLRSAVTALIERLRRIIDIACESTHRSGFRVPKSLAVTYECRESLVKTYAKDISEGGLFIRTGAPLPEGERFLLRLHLPGLARPMEMECQVAWARARSGGKDRGTTGMGVKFVGITRDNREILKPYIRIIERMGIPVAGMTRKDGRILKQYLDIIHEEILAGNGTLPGA